MIALIGGSGFIGSTLGRLLTEAGKDFCIVDKSPSPWFANRYRPADIRDLEALTRALKGCTQIVHLAAEHKDNVVPVSLYTEVNVEGTRNVTLAARELGIEDLLFTSSVAVYGFVHTETDETGAVRPFNEYGRTKFAAEEILRQWQGENPEGRRLVILRPTVVFGERNRGNVYNLLHQIAGGRFAMIGPGTNMKSMVYVENVASFLLFLLNSRAEQGIFNVVDKPDFSMNELVKTVYDSLGAAKRRTMRVPYALGYLGGLGFDLLGKILGREFSISAIRVKKFCATTQFSSQRVLNTGFCPPFPMAKALERTVKWEFGAANKSGETVFESE